MSEKRKKRNRKANSTSVRGLQTREEQLGVQAETESMPQPESETVAETDTTNTKQGGNKMYGQSFMDRIREHKTTIIQALVIVAITVVVSTLMITGLAATKGALNTETARVNGEFDKVSTHINSLGSGINDQINDLEEEVSGYGTTATENSHDIEVLQDWVEGAETRITTVEAKNSPPKGYLTGTAGNYTLYAKCSEAGNFTANIHFIYSPAVAVGNTTYDNAVATFYGSINWTAPGIKAYVPILTYNSMDWLVNQVWFNIGTFAMVANNETAVAIPFSGLNSTYAPYFAYVEVWPVLK